MTAGQPLSVLIVDDEPLAREGLAGQVARHAGFTVTAQCGDGRQALAALKSRRFDLLLLDVEMPELDGFGVLAQADPTRLPAVVFVTAYDQYAVRAFEAHALDYLLKPVDPERLAAALQRVRDVHAAGRDRARLEALLDELADRSVRPERLLVHERGRTLLVPVDEIDRLQAAGNYVRVHVGARVLLQRQTLARLLGRLDPARFCQVHRSHVVALARVEEVASTARGDAQVRLTDGTSLPVSRRFRRALEAALAGR